jgi:hypothetical protein
MPFKKGDPMINRKGRPKRGETFTDILNVVLREESVTYKGEQITGKEAAARKLLELAMGGDVSALKYIADRIDGLPVATNNVNTTNIPKITVVVSRET